MATYNSGAEYADRQMKMLGDLMSLNIPFRQTVYDDLITKSNRIFRFGLNTALGQIGVYSTKPMYVNPNFTPRAGSYTSRTGGKMQGLLPTRGKPTKSNPAGETHFNAKTKILGAGGTMEGEPHRTTYLKGGYKELRNRTGRRIDFVNLQFTNDLFLDYCNITQLGAPPQPQMVSQHEYIVRFKRYHNVEKKKGLEKKYGKIFDSNPQEIDLFVKRLNQNVSTYIQKLSYK